MAETDKSKTKGAPKRRRVKTLGTLEVTDLAAFARCSARTVVRWGAGEPVQARTAEALRKGASKYGIVVSQEPARA